MLQAGRTVLHPARIFIVNRAPCVVILQKRLPDVGKPLIQMMRIRVKLFASLARYFNNGMAGTPFDIEVADGATLADLVNQLKLPHEEVKVFFVNGRPRPMEWSLGPSDEVGIFPLIAGG